MARPREASTLLIEEHPDADLEEINTLLREAQMQEFTESELEQRRKWIAERAARKARGKSRTASRRPEAKKKRGDKRASPRLPKPGSMSEFACALPYDLPEKLVWELALKAGFEGSAKTISTARTRYPNLKKRFKLGAGDRFLLDTAAQTVAVEHGRLRRLKYAEAPAPKAPTPRRASAPPPTPARVNGTPAPALVHHNAIVDQARTELAQAVMRAGLTVAEQVLEELKRMTFGGRA